MKKKLLKKILGLSMLFSLAGFTNAQTVSTFDDPALTLLPDTFWNGSDLSGGFTSGSAFFLNEYDVTYDTWSGFSYSNMKDTLTAGYGNQYSAYTGKGYNNSPNYAIGNIYSPAKINLIGALQNSTISGFFVTNTTYAGLSMKDGDSFAKKFGGITGDDPDWFMLSITGYSGGIPITDTVEFYLADFRFSNNSEDYILNTWEWVDLTPLGNIDSLSFGLSSSDVGMWGMNTPAYFALDNFNGTAPTGLKEDTTRNIFSIYPNPANQFLNVALGHYKGDAEIKIIDLTGKMVYNNKVNNMNDLRIDLNGLSNGFYAISLQIDGLESYQKFIKQ